MREKQIVAIDVGSSNVVIAVASIEDDGNVNIMGIVSEPISGVAAGCIENSVSAGQAIDTAKSKIEKMLDIRITEAYAGLSGDYIRCVQVTDHVYVQDELRNGSNQITQRDLEDLDRRMKSVKLPPDEREAIMMMEPLCYKIDNREVESPVGAYGHVLSATYNFVLCDKMKRDRLRSCLQHHNIKVKEFVPNAFISHMGVATSDEIQDGVVVVDLGGGVTDVTVLLGGKVRHAASIPIGTNSINDDIRSLTIPSNYVEDLKVRYGSAIAELAADDQIVFHQARHGMVKSILRKNLVVAIEARLMDIAEWVRKEIKEAGFGSKFIPSVLLVGGGSEMRHIENLFARELGYDDVRPVHPEYGFTSESLLEHVNTPAYATVTSLLLYGATRGVCAVSAVQRPMVETPRVATSKPQPERPAVVETRKAAPITIDDSEDEEINLDDGDDLPTKGGKGFFSNIFKKVSDKVSKSFSDEQEESDF
jgi:cell division protein FtsA